VLFESELVDRKIAFKTLRRCAQVLANEFAEGVNSAIVATKVHKTAYEIIGVSDPYQNLKRESTQVAYQLFPRAQLLVERSEPDKRFMAATLCSIIGNLLDFGYTDFKTPYKLLGMFDKLYKEGLEIDDTRVFAKILKSVRNVVYFTDNCGEIVFDQLLINEIKKYKINLTIVAKEVPILTDATIADIRKVGLDRMCDELLTTGGFAVGVDFSRISDRLRRKLEYTDLVICKGMANFESFSDTTYTPIVYLMRVKCNAVATAVGTHKDTNVVKLYE
jgi:hypothetical protein